MAVGNPIFTRLQGYGTARYSGSIFRGPGADLYRRILPVMPCWRRLQGRYPHDFAGYFSWSGVDRPPHAAVRVAVHGGTTAGAGPLPAHGKGPLALAAIVYSLD